MKISLLFTLLLTSRPAFANERGGCHGDNCANHVTGTFGGIGVSYQSRRVLCQSYMRATVKLAPTTVTHFVTKYTTKMPQTTESARNSLGRSDNATGTTAANETILAEAVPTFAALECPSAGQFSSACACWSGITASTTTLPRATATATATTYLNVACSPAAMSVSKARQFPCSRQWGMCSCLRSEEDGDVCVRIGDFGGYGNGAGPCEKSKECNASGGCDDPATMCVYDGSCRCGKRRCYRAAPRGCDYQGLPMDGSQRQ